MLQFLLDNHITIILICVLAYQVADVYVKYFKVNRNTVCGNRLMETYIETRRNRK